MLLALSGCIATHVTPLAPLCWPSHGSPRGSTVRWGQCLGDAQLSVLIAHAASMAPSSPSAQSLLSAEIAARYITLRAQQATLVLLAERENLDSQQVVTARQRFTAGASPRRAAEAQLMDTRADQARTRAEIAGLRVRLSVLTGLPLGALASMPGGPIPLPPPMPVLADYRAAAAEAQAEAIRARAAANQPVLRAQLGEALAADRRALAALQAEERARAAMTEAYVALAKSLGRDVAAR